ncbi:hypothetical protein EDD85DRAFT_82836 [Armillaria nabsnona]|nr:hypothetical protein EDD85DRAFT_82836 [Armillaria nabsnona]
MSLAETVLKAAVSFRSASPLCSICPPGLPKLSKHPVQKVRHESQRIRSRQEALWLHLRGRGGDWPASIEDFQAWLLNERHVHGTSFFVLLSSENAALLKKRRWYVDPPKHFRGNLFRSIRVKTYQIVQGNYNNDHFASSWSSETYTLWEDALLSARRSVPVRSSQTCLLKLVMSTASLRNTAISRWMLGVQRVPCILITRIPLPLCR